LLGRREAAAEKGKAPDLVEFMEVNAKTRREQSRREGELLSLERCGRWCWSS